MTSFLCKTCGTQFPESDAPPRACPICEDERQYVPAEGQEWVTYDDVCRRHHAEIREEQPRLTGIAVPPRATLPRTIGFAQGAPGRAGPDSGWKAAGGRTR